MNEDRTISLITDGDEIGKVSLYPMTRRHVKEVRYFYPDGTIDFIEEYAADGNCSQLFIIVTIRSKRLLFQ